MLPDLLRPLARPSLALAFAGACLVTAAQGCSSDPARECVVGADCASGQCAPDGTCVRGPAPDGAADGGDAASGDATTGADGSSDAPADGPALPGCSPNKDGVITAAEVPLKAGLRATYRVGTNESVDTAGTKLPDGTRTWDFSTQLASDRAFLVETLPLGGKWYESKFVGATYATQLRASSPELGIFEVSPTAVLLRGVVTPDGGVFRTEVTHAPPPSMLAFPLSMGKKWTADANVSGFVNGVLAPYSESYTFEVDARGTLKTPLGTFDVLRVQILLERTVGLLTTTVRSFGFVSECYGTVATVASADNEQDVEFTRAAELQRISP
jgi:hypothetical protein